MVVQIYSEIEISRPPLEVKKIFMEFSSIPKWYKAMTIRLRNPDKEAIEDGDGLEIDFDGTVLQTVVIKNTANVFAWRGSFYGLVIGEHIFQFLDSEENPGGTKLIQTEDITGVLQFLFAPWWPEWLGGINKKSTNSFNELNGNLKEWAERSG